MILVAHTVVCHCRSHPTIRDVSPPFDEWTSWPGCPMDRGEGDGHCPSPTRGGDASEAAISPVAPWPPTRPLLPAGDRWGWTGALV